MLGLGAYQSSSEDEEERRTPPPAVKSEKKKQPEETLKPAASAAQPASHQNNHSQEASPAPTGPVLGPSHVQGPEPPTDDFQDGQASPYSTSRTLIQDLTLPPVPNLDIPPSPPGSPEPAANAKFAHFLTLKKQGVHFNEKLAGSASLKNPSLLKKLMDHAGIDDQTQYHTSLSTDLWDTTDLPKWGFKEELLKTQQGLRQRAEEKKTAGQRDSIEFTSGGRAG